MLDENLPVLRAVTDLRALNSAGECQHHELEATGPNPVVPTSTEMIGWLVMDESWVKSSHSFSNGNCVEWRKSTRSMSNGQCLEVHGSIRVRDSQDPDGPVLTFSPDAWREFTARIVLA